jgi:hypothetical protein
MIIENLLRACYYLSDYPANDNAKCEMINILKLDDWADIYTIEGSVSLLCANSQTIEIIKNELVDNIKNNTKPIQETTRIPDNYPLIEQISEIKSPLFDTKTAYEKHFLLWCGLDKRLQIVSTDKIINEETFLKFQCLFAHTYNTMYMRTLPELLDFYKFVVDENDKLVNTNYIQNVLHITNCKSISEIKKRANTSNLYKAKKLYEHYLKQTSFN